MLWSIEKQVDQVFDNKALQNGTKIHCDTYSLKKIPKITVLFSGVKRANNRETSSGTPCIDKAIKRCN